MRITRDPGMSPLQAGHTVSLILQRLCALMALCFIALFIFVAVQTLAYPFHIEWMEGHVIDIIQRVRQGLPVYAKPSLEYVSFAYTPYFYYVAAFVSLFTGVDFLPARLVSFMAALGTGGILYLWVRRENGSLSASMVAAGAYFSTYILSGRWMDVSRVDSLFLFLTLAGMYLFYFNRDWRWWLATAAVVTAACFTKQTAAIAMAPAFGMMLLLNPRHSLAVAALVFTAVIVFSVIGHYMTDGWSTFFIYELEAGHGIQHQHVWGFWKRDLLPNVGIMMALGLATILLWSWQDWRKGLWYGALALGFIACSYAARLNWGGYLNVLMPACCVLALLTGLSMRYAQQYTAPWPAIGVSLLVAAQLYMMFYDPYRYIPPPQAVEKGNRFLEQLAKVDGEILMPEVQFVQTRVGKKSYTLGMASLDVIATDMKEKNYIKEDLIREIKQAIHRQEFGAVVPGGVVPTPGVRKFYKHQLNLKYPREFVSETRNFLRRGLMVPRDDVKPERGSHDANGR